YQLGAFLRTIERKRQPPFPIRGIHGSRYIDPRVPAEKVLHWRDRDSRWRIVERTDNCLHSALAQRVAFHVHRTAEPEPGNELLALIGARSPPPLGHSVGVMRPGRRYREFGIRRGSD